MGMGAAAAAAGSERRASSAASAARGVPGSLVPPARGAPGLPPPRLPAQELPQLCQRGHQPRRGDTARPPRAAASDCCSHRVQLGGQRTGRFGCGLTSWCPALWYLQTRRLAHGGANTTLRHLAQADAAHPTALCALASPGAEQRWQRFDCNATRTRVLPGHRQTPPQRRELTVSRHSPAAQLRQHSQGTPGAAARPGHEAPVPRHVPGTAPTISSAGKAAAGRRGRCWAPSPQGWAR